MPLFDVAARNAGPAAKTQRLFDGRCLYPEVILAGGRSWRQMYRFAGKDEIEPASTPPRLRRTRKQMDERNEHDALD